MDYDKIEHNLTHIIDLFKNRANHLAKYLISNNSFNDEFISLVSNSTKLGNIPSSEYQRDFSTFQEMDTYFNNLLGDINVGSDPKKDIKISNDLNNKLFMLLSSEKYEDAIKLRDYMIRQNIKIII